MLKVCFRKIFGRYASFKAKSLGNQALKQGIFFSLLKKI